MAIDIGRIAYQKYCDSLNDPNPLPKWEELNKIQQDAWRAAAVAVLQYIDSEHKRMASGDEAEG